MENRTKRENEKFNKENKIINTAETLFCNNGFDATSMNELAHQCGYTKRTIYKYFTSKEDIFFAVLYKNYSKLLDAINRKIDNNLNGFEKIKSLYLGFSEYSSANPNLTSIMVMGKSAKTSDNSIPMPYRSKFYDCNKKLFSQIHKLFEEGQKDGSIKKQFDISTLAFSSVFTMTGFFYMLSSSIDTFTTHFNLNKDDFVNFSINLLTDSFKN